MVMYDTVVLWKRGIIRNPLSQLPIGVQSFLGDHDGLIKRMPVFSNRKGIVFHRMNTQPENDDSFTLYDLRVEVICPPGERILCGAKPGDHFILEGEMLRLPPGQGFSIYSLGLIL
jgi:hypothetical protein